MRALSIALMIVIIIITIMACTRGNKEQCMWVADICLRWRLRESESQMIDVTPPGGHIPHYCVLINERQLEIPVGHRARYRPTYIRPMMGSVMQQGGQLWRNLCIKPGRVCIQFMYDKRCTVTLHFMMWSIYIYIYIYMNSIIRILYRHGYMNTIYILILPRFVYAYRSVGWETIRNSSTVQRLKVRLSL